MNYNDPHVPVIWPSREHADFAGRKSVTLSAAALLGGDLVLVATNHKAVDANHIAAHAQRVLDSSKVLSKHMKGQPNSFKA
jgi:UDP-N-acetyl-D-glucosamine dehydrogenase